jgi:hypothetical protein
MKVLAKFMLTGHRHDAYGPDAERQSHEFTFTPQYDPNLPEDQRFNKASPSGSMTIRVDNLSVVHFWVNQMGRQFYLDFTPADADGA